MLYFYGNNLTILFAYKVDACVAASAHIVNSLYAF